MRRIASRAKGLIAAACLLVAVSAAPASAASITVTTTADGVANDAECTLREAIIAANANAAANGCAAGDAFQDNINFSITGPDPPVISVLGSALPALTERTNVNAVDQNGFVRVTLSGTSAGAGADGLTFASTAGDSFVGAIVIQDFLGDGIEVAASGFSMTGSFIGTTFNGNGDAGNSGDGVRLVGAGADSATIGGTIAANANVISGNGDDGIEIDGVGAENNLIQGNFIGLGVLGAVVANGGDGILVTNGSGTTIGGFTNTTADTCDGSCNVIAGNAGSGVELGPGSTNTTVVGNHLGVAADGTSVAGNQRGVHISGSDANTIGGTTAPERNVISGNLDAGVQIDGGTNATGNFVGGNRIGTNSAGTDDRGNAVGIEIAAPGNTIGGNLISGNSGDGVLLDGLAAAGNVLEGNIVGLGADGASALGNGGAGIHAENATTNLIGGDAPAARNVVSANIEAGIDLNGTSDHNTVSGNFVGTEASGTTAAGNLSNGIEVSGASNRVGGVVGVTPGGACTGECNLVSGNAAGGIRVGDDLAPQPTSGTLIQGNRIGTAADGSGDLGNGANGIFIRNTDTDTTTVGGAGAGAANVIAGNTLRGILIDLGADDTLVRGNTITGNDTSGVVVAADDSEGHDIDRNVGTNGALFLDLAPDIGPGTDPLDGANNGVQPPTITTSGPSAAAGTAPAGSTVRVYTTSDAAGANVQAVTAFVGAATANGSGSWTLAYGAPLPSGARIAATENTAADTSEFTLATEADPPETTIDSGPGEGATITTSSAELSFSSEPGATFQCSLDGGAFGDCTSPLTLSALSDAEHTFRVRATDAAGNVDPSPAARSFVVDAVSDTPPTQTPPAQTPPTQTPPAQTPPLTPPGLTSDTTRPVVSGFRLRGRRFGFRLSEPARVTIVLQRRRGRRFVGRRTLRRPSARTGANTIARPRRLRPGRYRASITATDAAGNVSRVVRLTFRVR